jgi:hypothetical protein
MPRRPAPVKPKNKPSHKLSKTQAGAYGEIVQKHLNGDGTWTYATTKAISAEANRLLGIRQGKTDSEFRARTPKREARMSTAVMDRRFDSSGRRAS